MHAKELASLMKDKEDDARLLILQTYRAALQTSGWLDERGKNWGRIYVLTMKILQDEDISLRDM